jgi:hypothetical protein
MELVITGVAVIVVIVILVKIVKLIKRKRLESRIKAAAIRFWNKK